jgi:hypothetical protein
MSKEQDFQIILGSVFGFFALTFLYILLSYYWATIAPLPTPSINA